MDQGQDRTSENGTPLRRGWTTGACATAATRSALLALLGRGFEDPVTITLPGGQQPAFVLAHEARGDDFAEAGIIKDAGDDPDVTHGALIVARVEPGAPGSGVRFRAGKGVGTVTKPGLPLGVGEPAINPVPRSMMAGVVSAIADQAGVAADFTVTVSVPGGEGLAQKTWNPRLGIVGGLSILGTTGIVVPYSCSAWIHSIHRGIDVARAMGLTHLVGSTGDLSEKAARLRYGLPEEAYLDMGDFVGGLLKYLRTHPVERITIAGGFAKLCKLATGAMDLHSARSSLDPAYLAGLLAGMDGPEALVELAKTANTANEVLTMTRAAGLHLADVVAEEARKSAARILQNPAIEIGVLVVDRAGGIVGEVV
jgi:cobalt-precorrin-5B (C1)-methyltransferase